MRANHTSNIAKLSVFEDDELLSSGDLIQTSDCLVGEVFNDVCMRFEHTYLVSNIFG
jgi:hypothetical protein